ncbi:MAG: hypothetical protein CM1200mP14_10020 [Gammaproteobacteria bacterium]|nr:MAG: hypothetical protein CM1200mP14_10020 [Gammaproteobacteria bacterium]
MPWSMRTSMRRPQDFNLDQLRGTETDIETVASVMATPPMMAEWRVVVVREGERIRFRQEGSRNHARGC